MENEITTSTNVKLSSLGGSISKLVSKQLTPVFMLFDFFELEQKIFDDIVDKFKNGKVT
jgi:hypothetical protein